MIYASWLQRAAGYLVDAGIAFAPSLVGGLIYETTVDPNGRASTVGRIADVVGIAIAVGVFAYNRWVRAGRTGNTWGRQAMRIRMVGEQTGEPVGGGTAFLRDLGHLTDTLALGIGWLVPLWDTKRQTFTDKIVGTVVLRAA